MTKLQPTAAIQEGQTNGPVTGRVGETVFRHDQGGREEEFKQGGGWVRQKAAATPRSDSGRKSEGSIINHLGTKAPRSKEN